MKTLTQFNIDNDFDIISEGILSKLGGFFSKVYKLMKKNIKLNVKNEQIHIDTKKLKRSNVFKFEDLINSKEYQEIIFDKQIGFSTLSQIIQNKNKYLKYNDETNYKPEIYMFFMKDKNSINFVGTIGYDKNIKLRENYLTLFICESSLIVDKSVDIIKFMLENLTQEIKNNDKNILGFEIKPVHPKIKADVIKGGFKVLNDNKEILYYNF